MKKTVLIIGSIILLILCLIVLAQFMGCISTSMSTGSSAGSEAEASAKIGQKASSVEESELSTGEMTIEIKDHNGNPVASIKTAPTTAKMGSTSTQQADTKSIASASAEASAEAVNKATKSLWWIWVLIVLATIFTVGSRILPLIRTVKKIIT